MSKRDMERDEQIASYRDAGMRLRTIGEIFGISEERVRQLIKRFDREQEAKFWDAQSPDAPLKPPLVLSPKP